MGWQENVRAREPRRSESSVESSSGLTWLQRQQQKLRERKEARERVARLPLEWDTAPSRQVRRSASHRYNIKPKYQISIHHKTFFTLLRVILIPQGYGFSVWFCFAISEWMAILVTRQRSLMTMTTSVFRSTWIRALLLGPTTWVHRLQTGKIYNFCQKWN